MKIDLASQCGPRAPRGQWRRRGRSCRSSRRRRRLAAAHRNGHGQSRPAGATVKLKIAETAFSACDVAAKRPPFLILLIVIVLARLCLDVGRPKRKPSRLSPPSFPVVQNETNPPYNSLCAHDGCRSRFSRVPPITGCATRSSTRHFPAMPYGARNIWGVTTGISRTLYERLYC